MTDDPSAGFPSMTTEGSAVFPSTASDAPAVAQRQFIELLQTTLQVSWTALDLARMALRSGNSLGGEGKIRGVEDACETIRRFLPKVANPEDRESLAIELRKVEGELQILIETTD